jgi:hypothetical protein
LDIAHNKEPIAKTVETEADHVSRNQLSDESDSDEDIVTHVVPTRHKISEKQYRQCNYLLQDSLND